MIEDSDDHRMMRPQALPVRIEPGTDPRAGSDRGSIRGRMTTDLTSITEDAMHALRLGRHGVELLTTGRITLPVPGGISLQHAGGKTKHRVVPIGRTRRIGWFSGRP